MMTVNEVSKLTGVSIRTLQYYDTIGLLKPIQYTESGYRLYDDTSLEECMPVEASLLKILMLSAERVLQNLQVKQLIYII